VETAPTAGAVVGMTAPATMRGTTGWPDQRLCLRPVPIGTGPERSTGHTYVDANVSGI